MLSVTFFPRDEQDPENLAWAARYIGDQFEKAGARVSRQSFDARGATFGNVIATVGPATRERLVVGAHYDVEGRRPGADDNASGVAGLLELAGMLRTAPPRMRVDLVAYALEEPPYFNTSAMGSAVHAESLRRDGIPLRAMIALEMIGYFQDAPRTQTFPFPALAWLYPSTGNFVAVVGNLGQIGLVRRVKGTMRAAGPLPVYSINAPRLVPGIDFSDHLNYWAAGYPAVMISDTAFYRNPNYHTARDTPDTLDYRRMAEVVRGVYAVVRVLTDGETPP
jgi:Zn-dependent M28 family amino/carboxypeptidase